LPWLTSATANEDLARQLLHEAEGQPLTALQYLNEGTLQKQLEMEKEFIATLAGKLQPLTLAERWKEYELQDILKWLQRKLTMLIRAVQAGASVPEIWRDYASQSAVELYPLLDQVNELALKVRHGANPNRQLVVEALLLDCYEVLR
jgi:uncharacterized protein YifE (UPF0438 family)